MQTPTQTAIARFLNVRAPQAVSDTGLSRIRLIRPPEEFSSELLEEADKEKVEYRDGMIRLAAHRIETITDTLFAMNLVDAVRAAVMPRAVTAEAAGNALRATTGRTPAQLLKLNAYRKRWNATWELYYCQSVLGRDRRETANTLRAAQMVADIEGMAPAAKPGSWTDALGWRPAVPKALFRPDAPKPAPDDPRAKETLDEVRRLRDEVELLRGLSDKVTLEDRRYYSLGEGAKSKLDFVLDGAAREARPTRKAMEDLLTGPGGLLRDRVPDIPELSRKLPAVDAAEIMVEPENWVRRELGKPQDKSVFTKDEHAYLRRNEAVVLRESERNVVDALMQDTYRRASDLLLQPGRALPAAVAAAPETRALMTALAMPQHKVKTKVASGLSSGSLPRVHVLGIGDLIVIEEQIDRYELGEIAHIENVMAKETRGRTHLRISETETTLTVETEETATDERSLQTTDRFELTKETQSQLESSLEVTAGASVSAGYGPVSVSANTGLTSSVGASTGRSTASSLAREAVEKAVSTVTSRVREEQIIRTLQRIEETNEHGFVNDTDANLTGVYRWVDKYYTVRAVNYGRRLMLEMIVPEPANGLVYAEEMHADEEVIAPPPPPITFGPNDVTRHNYLDYAEIYGAVDIPAPPANVIDQTLTYGGVGDGSNRDFAEAGKTITIPDGYRTTNVWRASWVITYGGTYISKHFAGSKSVDGTDSTLTGVTGTLQVTSLMHAAAFQAGWRVRCELSDEAYDAWRLAAWAAIRQAYDAAVSAHEEKLAAQAIGRGVHIHGRNPEQNREIIRNELKRGAIKYLSNDMGQLIVAGTLRTNEVFDAADDTGDFDLDEARIEGMIIQFFEQAFEWHNMTWLLYPYFWAKTARQHQKLLAEDDDPAMRDFLGAGAARVVVPVPEEYEDAVLNFFETNEIWNGGEPPMVDDPEYVSIAEELKQGRTNSFNSPIYYEGAGTPPPFIVDEWEVKLPTSLVQLQADGTLPSFPSGLFETDAPALLDARAASTGTGAGWRNSVVDLLTLYGVADAGDEAARRAFATSVGYPGDPEADALASVDSWCYFYVLGQVELNGLA